MANYIYIHGSKNNRESVRICTVRENWHDVICTVDVDLLMCGIDSFPCGEGDIVLSVAERLEILKFVKAERKKITDSYAIKTYNGWQNSGFRSFQDFCVPGDLVDEAMVDYFVNIVPPVLQRSSCTQCGEPYSYEMNDRENPQKTYTTFHQIIDGLWQYDGCCFYGENQNRVLEDSQLDSCIEALTKALEVS